MINHCRPLFSEWTIYLRKLNELENVERLGMNQGLCGFKDFLRCK